MSGDGGYIYIYRIGIDSKKIEQGETGRYFSSRAHHYPVCDLHAKCNRVVCMPARSCDSSGFIYILKYKIRVLDDEYLILWLRKIRGEARV